MSMAASAFLSVMPRAEIWLRAIKETTLGLTGIDEVPVVSPQ
jgi:hypothetical protein